MEHTPQTDKYCFINQTIAEGKPALLLVINAENAEFLLAIPTVCQNNLQYAGRAQTRRQIAA